MSQYPYPPPPYSPPTVDPAAWAYAPPHAEGRAAALWQFLLGGLIFLGGTCIGLLFFMPDDLLNEVARQQQHNLQPIGHLSPIQEIRLMAGIGSGVMLAAGGLLLLLAIFVRLGGKASTICSIILNCLVGLFLGLSLLSDLIQVAGNPMVLAPLVISLGVLALCIVTIAKLVIALKSSGSAQSQAMQQAYYWMMQQQQAGAHGQAGYGWQGGYPPPQNPLPQNPSPPMPENPAVAPDQPPSMPSDREK